MHNLVKYYMVTTFNHKFIKNKNIDLYPQCVFIMLLTSTKSIKIESTIEVFYFLHDDFLWWM